MHEVDTSAIVRELLVANRSSKADLAEIQDRRLRRLLAHAQESSPYYRRLLAGRDVADVSLDELPIMTKSKMMAHFDEIVTDPALRRAGLEEFLADHGNIGRRYLDRYGVFQSSGTTGETAIVACDEVALAYFYAVQIARRSLPSGLSPREHIALMQEDRAAGRQTRRAFVVVTSGPTSTYVVAMLGSPNQRSSVDRRVFSTSWPVARIVEELNDFKPHHLVCYASMLEILAREQLAGRLRISFDTPTSGITTGGEPLTPAVAALAHQAFGIPIEDAYGLTEVLALGRSCSRFDGLHLMTDLCVVEVVDREGRRVPDGTIGSRLLVTNLVNDVQPVFRYEVTDVTGISTDECECGWPFPRILPVAGRTTDVLYIDDPEGGYETISAYRFGFVFLLTGLRRFQLVQTARNEVTLKYVPLDPAETTNDSLAPIVAEELAKAGLAGRVELVLDQVEEIPVDPRTGKLRQITSLVGPPPELARELTPNGGRSAPATPR